MNPVVTCVMVLSGEITACSGRRMRAAALVSLLALVSSIILPVTVILRAVLGSQRREVGGVITVRTALSVSSADGASPVALRAGRVTSVVAPASVPSVAGAAWVTVWRAAVVVVIVTAGWMVAGLPVSSVAVAVMWSPSGNGGMGALPAPGEVRCWWRTAASSALHSAPVIPHLCPAVLVVRLHTSRRCVFLPVKMCSKKCPGDGKFLCNAQWRFYYKDCSNKYSCNVSALIRAFFRQNLFSKSAGKSTVVLSAV